MSFLKTFLLLTIVASFAFAADDPKSAVAALKATVTKSGQPKLDGTAKVAGKTVPNITFGTTKIANNFDAVDDIKRKLGGTATIFVKDGEEFTRISTNVLVDDGSRALGTNLARNKAYEAVNKGETFCGTVDILGSNYDTCYEPIKADNKVIGIYYFGFKK